MPMFPTDPDLLIETAHELYCSELLSYLDGERVDDDRKQSQGESWSAYVGRIDRIDERALLGTMARLLGRIEQAWGADFGMVAYHAGWGDKEQNRALFWIAQGALGCGVSLSDHDDLVEGLEHASTVLKGSPGALDPNPIDLVGSELFYDHIA
jgi:hypothetical protein